ncbi:MAG: MOSC domain-containing protein [Flavobacteriales bacterium]|nr:MOSC domain-containing protein [Flavobacteriales bacterium]
MKIISLNTGISKTVTWRGKDVKTGIFKSPVDRPIFLGKTDVVNDDVVDRRFHGGTDKAVYAYSADHYPFWKKSYPNLEWNFGMFGENLTVLGMDESKMLIGSIYKLGEAEVQVCQPRQPCFKLGIRFGTQSVLKQFVSSPYPGVYFRVLKSGNVKKDDVLELLKEEPDSPSILEVYKLMCHKQTDNNMSTQKVLNCQYLPASCKEIILSVQTR